MTKCQKRANYQIPSRRYLSKCQNKGVSLLLLYVDNMIITSDDLVVIEDLRRSISHHFGMKYLGNLS